LDTPIIYNKGGEKEFSGLSIFIIYCRNAQEPSVRKRYSEEQEKHISNDDLYNSCQLIRDFKDGTERLEYCERWSILTNVVHISGALKYYRDIINSLEETTYIYSELEQAVGRARLLNKDNTVYVHASFPVKQAEFMD
jgi:hypothetical protein